MWEALDKMDSLQAKAGTDKTRFLPVQMWLDDVRDFDEVHKVWDAWAPRAHVPSRSSGQAGWQSRECWLS